MRVCVRALSQELYITFVHQTRYQEISPPVAFSSSRAGAWCVGRGGAKGSMAARKRGRRTSDRGVARASWLMDGHFICVYPANRAGTAGGLRDSRA